MLIIILCWHRRQRRQRNYINNININIRFLNWYEKGTLNACKINEIIDSHSSDSTLLFDDLIINLWSQRFINRSNDLSLTDRIMICFLCHLLQLHLFLLFGCACIWNFIRFYGILTTLIIWHRDTSHWSVFCRHFFLYLCRYRLGLSFFFGLCSQFNFISLIVIILNVNKIGDRDGKKTTLSCMFEYFSNNYTFQWIFVDYHSFVLDPQYTFKSIYVYYYSSSTKIDRNHGKNDEIQYNWANAVKILIRN